MYIELYYASIWDMYIYLFNIIFECIFFGFDGMLDMHSYQRLFIDTKRLFIISCRLNYRNDELYMISTVSKVEKEELLYEPFRLRFGRILSIFCIGCFYSNLLANWRCNLIVIKLRYCTVRPSLEIMKTKTSTI